MDSYPFGFCCWDFPKIAWGPDLLDLVRETVTQLPMPVIAPVSISLTRIPSRGLSTGHESRRRHRGLGGRNFR